MIQTGGKYVQPVAIVVTLASLITYLMFVYRAMNNLHLSNARNLPLTPDWAVGWSFTAFATVGIVFNLMRQTSIVSHDPEASGSRRPSRLFSGGAAGSQAALLAGFRTPD